MGFFSSFFSAVGKAFAAVGKVLRTVVSTIASVARVIVNALVGVLTLVAKVIGAVVSWFSRTFGDFLGALIIILIIIAVVYFCPQCVQFLIEVANTVWGAVNYVFNAVSTALTTVWTEYLQPAWLAVKSAGLAVWNWISGIVNLIYTGLSALVATAWSVLEEIGSTLGSVVSYVSKLIGENPVLAAAIGATAVGINWTWVAVGGVVYLLLEDNRRKRS